MNKVVEFFRFFIKVTFDKHALALIIPSALILAYIDFPKLLTLAEWMLYAAVLAGFAIHISRLVFPQVRLSRLVELAEQSPLGSALIASATISFVGVVLLSLAIWTKP